MDQEKTTSVDGAFLYRHGERWGRPVVHRKTDAFGRIRHRDALDGLFSGRRLVADTENDHSTLGVGQACCGLREEREELLAQLPQVSLLPDFQRQRCVWCLFEVEALKLALGRLPVVSNAVDDTLS